MVANGREEDGDRYQFKAKNDNKDNHFVTELHLNDLMVTFDSHLLPGYLSCIYHYDHTSLVNRGQTFTKHITQTL